ncbi:ABC transporter substrate-binding protein [Methylomicrobium sp. Wu6]|uniref:ABC transporter substrate-binding protein n=1 Tax=Methylomicrobium sp. Wu6 TaxID=3107928 RepID=UPI002DD633D0|nr:ABC transporter substrate-binding protein [Methylomicrobium sp. Wu6]MEC4747486.1 transporter substrate-binding domain-containing protein [Methylomicrobium sp. Wu6]
MKLKNTLLSLLLSISCATVADDKLPIRIGVQATGTSGWELSVLERAPERGAQRFAVQTQQLANAEAGKIALQSGAVDMIISDWIWVSRMRAAGSDFTFYPYSTTSGALIVAGNSPIKALSDLKGKRLGIAGGEFDKNWLLLKALAKRQQIDLDASVEKVFGAPPLIDEQLKLGRIDAALNYWHFAARLEALGYRQIIDGKGILQGLGITEPVANLGYVFKQSWAAAHKQAINDFLMATESAKKQLCSADETWRGIIPLLKTDDPATRDKLRQRYCDGITQPGGKAERQAAERIYLLLRELSGKQLTGDAASLQPGTFWALD